MTIEIPRADACIAIFMGSDFFCCAKTLDNGELCFRQLIKDKVCFQMLTVITLLFPFQKQFRHVLSVRECELTADGSEERILKNIHMHNTCERVHAKNYFTALILHCFFYRT